jgi:hypothetical protein
VPSSRKPQERFMNQCSRIEGTDSALAAEMAGGQLFQFAVEKRNDGIERARVAPMNALEEIGNLHGQ